MVRELGLERRETVRFLSTVVFEREQKLFLVREDRNDGTTGGSVVGKPAPLKSYVPSYNR